MAKLPTSEKIKMVEKMCEKVILEAKKKQFLNALSWANDMNKELLELLNRALKDEL